MDGRPKQPFLQRRYIDCQQIHEKLLNITNYYRNVDQNYWAIMSYQSEWPPSKCLQTIDAEGGVGKTEPSYTLGEVVSWSSNYGEQYWGSLKKLNKELLYDPSIPLMGIHSENRIIQKYTCQSTFTAALFTIARTWKQLNVHQQSNG